MGEERSLTDNGEDNATYTHSGALHNKLGGLHGQGAQ